MLTSTEGTRACSKTFLRRVMVVEVLPAPLGTEIVKDEATKNVEGLLDVREAPDVASLNARGVVFSFEDDFT